jgi:hypothetical protein
MRLQIYVPKAQAERWSPDEGSISFGELQKRIVNIAGGITVTTATGMWKGAKDGYVKEPVYVVEALIERPAQGMWNGADSALWNLLRTYAVQLLAQGEESVLIVQDNEPTLISR